MITIIPAIDIIDGKCVRLSQGNYALKKVYNENPLEVAKAFEDAGIQRLHLVDLDGAKAGKIINRKVLENIANQTQLKIDFGGGIKTEGDLQYVFDAGAIMATIGSLAVKNPDLFFHWVETYGPEKILLAADVKDEMLMIGGWLESTPIFILDFIRTNTEKGVQNIFCTDISKDGLLQGASLDLYTKILNSYSKINFIASGGVHSMNDIIALEKIGCSGVIIGKAIYEGLIVMDDLKKYLC